MNIINIKSFRTQKMVVAAVILAADTVGATKLVSLKIITL